jgi:hypothetical protein
MGPEGGYSPNIDEIIKAERSMDDRQRELTETRESSYVAGAQSTEKKEEGSDVEELSKEERIENIYKNCDVVIRTVDEKSFHYDNGTNYLSYTRPGIGGGIFRFRSEDREDLRREIKSPMEVELLMDPAAKTRVALRVNGKIYPIEQLG